MTICGYNDKIGSGLSLLIEGMIESLEKKSTVRDIKDLLSREVLELGVMIETLETAESVTLAQMFVGLNVLAKALFEYVRQCPTTSDGNAWADECRFVGEGFNSLLSRVEEFSEGQKAMSPNVPVTTIAREVAKWALVESNGNRLLEVRKLVR